MKHIKLIISVILLSLMGLNVEAHSNQGKHHFIENKGQWHSNVSFKTVIPNGEMFIEKNAFTYNFYDGDAVDEFHHHRNEKDFNGMNVSRHMLQVEFLNSNLKTKLTGQNHNVARYNYIKGNDSSKWVSNANSYSSVNYEELYSGIDMKLYSKGDNLKYDFIIRPNADPNQINFKYKGADNIYKSDKGNLVIETSLLTITEMNPVAFQMINGQRQEVECHFVVTGSMIGFSFPNSYDNSKELIIDPELIYSTYAGSVGDNWGFTGTYDNQGNGYTGGIAFVDNASGYPTTFGAFQSFYAGGVSDVTISKYNPTGTNLMYATYIGGVDDDEPVSIIVNSNNELVILGNTNSANFPTTSGAYDGSLNTGFGNSYDIFVTILANDGSGLTGSTYIGGSSNDGRNSIQYLYGDISRGEVKLDDQDNIYVASNTNSNDFPATSGSFGPSYTGSLDACVFKLNNDVTSMIWSGMAGGFSQDVALGLVVDDNENVYVCGGTEGNFPITNNVLEENFSGGFNQNGMFPGTYSADGFVFSIRNDGTTIMKSSYVKSTDSKFDIVYFIDLDTEDNIFIYGLTEGNIPITDGIYSDSLSAQFIQKMTKGFDTLLLSTVFGNESKRGVISPTAFLVDQCNRIYVSGWGGPTSGDPTSNMTGFQVTDNAFQKTTDDQDFYIAVWDQDMSLLNYATYLGGNDSRGEHVDGGTSRFSPEGIIYQSVCASCGGGQFFPTTTGAYATTNLSSNCTNALFKMSLPLKNVRVDFDPENLDTLLCLNELVEFENESSNAQDFIWIFSNGDTIYTASDSSVTNTFSETGNYLITLVGINNDGLCFDKRRDTAFYNVAVFESPTADAGPDTLIEECENVLQLNGCCGDFYTWSPATFLSDSAISNPISTPEDSIAYVLTVTNESGCFAQDSVKIGFNKFEPIVPNVFTPNDDGFNEVFTIENVFCTYSLSIYNRWGKQVYLNEDYQSDFNGNFLVDGVYFFEIYNEHVSRKGWFQILR